MLVKIDMRRNEFSQRIMNFENLLPWRCGAELLNFKAETEFSPLDELRLCGEEAER